MAPATRTDPYLTGNFLVEIDGIASASFTEVSGLEASIDVIEYRTGNQTTVQKIPGLHKFTNITLKRGMVQDLSLWNWMQNGLNGNVQRAAVSIILLDEARNAVLKWSLSNAWPCKWTGPALNAQCNEVAIETLEITYENLAMSAD
jgi:phage tail-like protein